MIIVNLDRALGRTLKLNFGQDLSGRVADVQTMDAAINAENTLENQDNVTPVDSSVTFDAATPTVTVTPHSLTTLKIRPRAAGTINAAPVITASDRTITVGDAFDPLDGVTAHDAEDGDMPLAAANVTADDVDPILREPITSLSPSPTVREPLPPRPLRSSCRRRKVGRLRSLSLIPRRAPSPRRNLPPVRHQTRRRIKQPTRSRMTRQMGNRQTTEKQSCRILVPASWSR